MTPKIKTAAELVKLLRETNNLSVKGLAEKIYVSRQTIFYWEKDRNKVSVDNLALLTKVLNGSILIKDGEFNILEEKRMNKEEKMLKLDFMNFHIGKALDVAIEKEEPIVKLGQKLLELRDWFEENGYRIGFNSEWDIRMVYADFCQTGVVADVMKDEKIISIGILHDDPFQVFDIDAFIDRVGTEYGGGAAEHIKKVILFTACELGFGKEIYNCLKKNKSPESILNVMPLLDGLEEIVYNTLNKENYFTEYYDCISQDHKKCAPIGYSLNMCDETKDNYIYLTLGNEHNEFRLLLEPQEWPSIIDALEYVKNNFKDFDKLFEKGIFVPAEDIVEM